MSSPRAPKEPIYLDYNATTPIAEPVLEAMLPWLSEHHGNPSSGHAYGRRARDAVTHARTQVAELIGARPDEVVFTASGTEANNLAVLGLAASGQPRRHLVVSAVEHPAILAPAQRLEQRGWRVDRAPVDEAGVVDLGVVQDAVTDATALVSVMLANNETGALQPLEAVSALARAVGARTHTDAAQAIGKVPVDVDALGVDLLTLVGHKVYAPKGVAALYVRTGVELEPLLVGGGQERSLRPGTENVPYIVGLGVACALARERLESDAVRYAALRERLFDTLRARVPSIVRNADPSRCLPNTLSVRFAGARGSAVLEHAPAVAASTGSACHEGGETASAVLLAMGLSPGEALGTVRLSIGRGTDEDAIDRAADALATAYERAGG